MICTFEKTIFENAANGYKIASFVTNDKSVPENARNKFYSDARIRFTATGYNLPATDKIDVDLSGKWENSKYGIQYAVSSFFEIIPKTKN
jgi:exodeoxyribonuclease V alpha subunit